MTASSTKLDADDLLAYLDGVCIRSIIRDTSDRLCIAAWQKAGLICEQVINEPENKHRT